MDKHDIAISWLIVRLGSFQAGLDVALQQARRAESPEESANLAENIAEHEAHITAVQNSIDVLKRDAGIVSDAPAVQSADVLVGTIVEEG